MTIKEYIKNEIKSLEESYEECMRFYPNDEGNWIYEPIDGESKEKSMRLRFAILELESVLHFLEKDV